MSLKITILKESAKGKPLGRKAKVSFDGLHVINSEAEPFFLLRASDVVAFDVMSEYKNAVQRKRPHPTVIRRLQQIQASFAVWAAKNGTYPLYNEEPATEELSLESTSGRDREILGTEAGAGNPGPSAGGAGGSPIPPAPAQSTSAAAYPDSVGAPASNPKPLKAKKPKKAKKKP